MNKQLFTRACFAIVTPVMLVALCCPLTLHSQQAAPLDAGPIVYSILLAHNAWSTPPHSIRIQGTSIRNDRRQPVAITATGKEETATEYGSTKRVRTSIGQFEDNGRETAFASAPTSFSQLDITSVFFLSHLSQRKAVASASELVASGRDRVTRVHLSTGRTQIHYRQIKVSDELDVFVDASGLLTGIERTFYPQDSRMRFTHGYRFSDYRDTGGVLLPYRIDEVFQGETVENILVSAYQVGAGIDPSLFKSSSQARSAQ